ncbi:MAG: hypothetical protein AB7G08_33565 [Hyphomicrobiaceae bacterium]
MAKQKVPFELQEIAAELNLNLADEQNETEDLEELVEWVRHKIGEERAEATQNYDDLEAKLDDIVIDEPTE